MVKINGKPVDVSAEPGSYLDAGPHVEERAIGWNWTLPMRLSVETIARRPSLKAYLYGPVVLAADLGPASSESEAPVFKVADPNSTAWLKPGDGPLSFRTAGQRKDYPMAPLNSIFDKRYLVYLNVT